MLAFFSQAQTALFYLTPLHIGSADRRCHLIGAFRSLPVYQSNQWQHRQFCDAQPNGESADVDNTPPTTRHLGIVGWLFAMERAFDN